MFSKSENDIGQGKGVQCKIDISDSLPVKQIPRWLPLGKRQEADSTVEKMFEQGIIDTSPAHGVHLSSWLERKTEQHVSASTIVNSTTLFERILSTSMGGFDSGCSKWVSVVLNIRSKERVLAGRIRAIVKGENSVFLWEGTVAV